MGKNTLSSNKKEDSVGAWLLVLGGVFLVVGLLDLFQPDPRPVKMTDGSYVEPGGLYTERVKDVPVFDNRRRIVKYEWGPETMQRVRPKEEVERALNIR